MPLRHPTGDEEIDDLLAQQDRLESEVVTLFGINLDEVKLLAQHTQCVARTMYECLHKHALLVDLEIGDLATPRKLLKLQTALAYMTYKASETTEQMLGGRYE